MVKSIEKQPFILPGEYQGLWSAWFVEIIFHNGKKSEPIKVDGGVRGINCKCKVTVDNEGNVYVE